MSRPYTLRPNSEVPVFCKPIALFVTVWLVMLGCLHLRLSLDTYPDFGLAWALFGASLVSLLMGHLTVRGAYLALGHEPIFASSYQIDLMRLRRVQRYLIIVAVSVLILNLATEGLPPIFGIFGAQTLNYVDYGKLKQVLNTSAMALFLTAGLESSGVRKILVYGFAISCVSAYVTRGFLIVMLAQGLFCFCLRTKVSKHKLYFIAAAALVAGIVLAGFIGNSRSESTSEAFVAFFRIRRVYADLPMTLLWLTSYIAIPISNFCWIVHSYEYSHPSATFLTTLLPAFWSPPSLESGELGSSNIIDGVHTYMAKYYLDLWFFGVFFINYVWGLISGYLSSGNRLVSRFLTTPVLLAALGFIFFADYLGALSIVMELGILAFCQQYVIKDLTSTAINTL